MEAFSQLVSDFSGFIWGVPLIVLLLGSHLFFTIRTGFIQRKIPQAIKLSMTKDPDSEGDISQFGALTTALSATIGTGNIVGVGTAIALGGPGAVLWMWLTGVFGIATKYAETFVAVKYRVKDHKGNMLGGAMYAWRRAFEKDGKTPWWALLGAGAFALFAAVASFGIGSSVQSKALTEVVVSNIPGIPAWLIGLIVVVAVCLVIFGGIKQIANVCEKLIPFMAIAYFLGCVVILFINGQYLGSAIALICTSAFSPEALGGGAAGTVVMMAIRAGCARGLFSNESGMGSAPIAAAAAQTRNPARQSLVSMTGTFWDTVIICLMTGLVIVSTLLGDPSTAVIAEDPSAFIAMEIKGGILTSQAFASIPFVGTPILVLGMVLFAFTTILGWSYYGNRCVTYLFGRWAIRPYQILYVLTVFLGALVINDNMGFFSDAFYAAVSAGGDLVWNIADILNAFMVVPNILVVLLLSGMIARETKHYVYDGNLEETDTTPLPVVEDK